MKQFLDRGRYCDWDHPSIHAALSSVLSGVGSTTAAAVRLFEFVRDQVLYTFSPWSVAASETLAAREGMCTNKSNLLVALFRAVGIPAAYGVLVVNPQEYFGTIAPGVLKPLLSTRSLHLYAAALLDGRWVCCDPSTDAELSRKTAHFCRQTRLITWDGQQDALDFIQPQHVYEHLGLRASVDDILERPVRHATPSVIATLNEYVGFIREQPTFKSSRELISAYERTLVRAPWQA